MTKRRLSLVGGVPEAVGSTADTADPRAGAHLGEPRAEFPSPPPETGTTILDLSRSTRPPPRRVAPSYLYAVSPRFFAVLSELDLIDRARAIHGAFDNEPLPSLCPSCHEIHPCPTVLALENGVPHLDFRRSPATARR
ncbi:MAG: hypothetical protein JWP61_1273 [Friedmanniella sp.]|nr:hypothetical protein [Friedmanniella sp.]